MNIGSRISVAMILLWNSTRKRALFLLIAILFASGSMAADSEGSLIYSSGIFDALNHGGAVYLCTVSQREPTPDSVGEVIETGQVTLAVVKTLLGPERKVLVLPYCFATGFLKTSTGIVWPRLDTLGEKSLVCVVNPGLVDRLAPKIPGINEAASKVIVVQDSQDPKLEEVRVLCDLYQAVKSGNAASALPAALKDEREEVRVFALQAVVSELRKTDPNGAIAILKAQAQKWTDDNGSREGERLVAYILLHMTSGESPTATGEFMAHSLAVIATSHSPAVRRRAIKTLRFLIGSFSLTPDFHFPAALTPGEMADLIEALNGEVDATPAAAQLKTLLLRPSPSQK